MKASTTNTTAYKSLELWANKNALNADSAIEMVVDSFYKKNLDDERLSRFFVNVDLDNLKKHQFNFMRHIFSEGQVGKYTGESLNKAHAKLINEEGLNATHFDCMVENLGASFEELNVPREIIDQMAHTLGKLRGLFAEATSFTHSREKRLFFALDTDGDGYIPESCVREALKDAGLYSNDDRLKGVYKSLDANTGTPLPFHSFQEILGTAGLLVERALQNDLAIPDFSDFRKRVETIFNSVKENTSGDQARYIPPLAEVNPDQYGLAIVTTDGQSITLGDHDIDFSIQSMCKPFNYCFAVEELGAEEVHQHVGNEPSGRAFNDRDLMARLLSNTHDFDTATIEIPYNPMVNAGAIMTAALIKSGEVFDTRFRHVREMWSRMTGRRSQAERKTEDETILPRFNKEMARQENYTGYNNFALGYLLMATGRMPKSPADISGDVIPDNPDDYDFRFEPAVVDALKLYFATCSLEMNAYEMAMAASTLANGGVCPTTQERVLKQTTVRDCLSITQMCGMYDGSGDFFYSIGLPAKSGVGGGVILVVPKLMGICIFSPRLDAQGNSARGVDFARKLIGEYRLHLYDDVMTGGKRIDPRLPLARWRASQVSSALWAASTGDMRTLRRLHEEQVNLEEGDYDRRTPMHLAAAEGHMEVITFLLENGIKPVVDRWGGEPLSDALASGHTETASFFAEKGMPSGNPVHRIDDPSGRHDEAADFSDSLAVIELLWAAADNDVSGLRRLVTQGVPVHAQDYDRRTALHLAAVEGQLDAIKYLVNHGHPLNVRDRWGATPLDEALREERQGAAKYLSKRILE